MSACRNGIRRKTHGGRRATTTRGERRRLTDAGSSRRHARGMPARPQFRRPALVRITHAAGRRSPARLLPHRARANAGAKSPPHHRLHPRVAAVNRLDDLHHSLLEKTPTRRNTQQTRRLPRRTRTSYTRVTQQHALTNKDTVDQEKQNKKHRGKRRTQQQQTIVRPNTNPTRAQPAANARRSSEEEVCRRPRSKHSGRRSAVPHHASVTVAVIVNRATQRQAKAADGGRVVESRRRLRRRTSEGTWPAVR